MKDVDLMDVATRFQNQLVERFGKSFEKAQELPDVLETMKNVEVGQTPSETVYSENKLTLNHYEPMTETQHDVPVLVVYALINKPYILDLQPGRSVIETFLENGFDVYMIEWGEPSYIDQHLELYDYVQRYIANCVDVVRRRSGQDSINLFGYCMGGSMSAMYAALNPRKVRNLILLATGLCFDNSAGLLERWGSEEYFNPEAITDSFGNVPAEFLAAGFDLMNPVENLVTKYVDLYEGMENEDFVENFARMNKWIYDGVDVAGKAYTEFIRKLYQQNQLMNNELHINGQHVDIENITMPVLQIMGEYDHLMPPEASKPFNDAVPSEDTEVYEFPSGHAGLCVSSHSQKELWPRVCDWMEDRSNGSDAPETGGATNGQASDLEEIEGIGPTYAGRLREAGITSRASLAVSDAATVAEAADVSETRAGSWIDAA